GLHLWRRHLPLRTVSVDQPSFVDRQRRRFRDDDSPASPPIATGFFAGVGTTIFNMIVNPANGHVYVSNTDARNEHRFEGAGEFLKLSGKKPVRGNIAESRIPVIGDGVSPRQLNKHIARDAPLAPIPNDENRRSLAFPTDMAISE